MGDANRLGVASCRTRLGGPGSQHHAYTGDKQDHEKRVKRGSQRHCLGSSKHGTTPYEFSFTIAIRPSPTLMQVNCNSIDPF